MARQSNSNVRLPQGKLATQSTSSVDTVKRTDPDHSRPASYTQLISLNGSFDMSDYVIMRPDITLDGSKKGTTYLGSDFWSYGKPISNTGMPYYLKEAANYQQGGRVDQDLYAIGSWIETEQKSTVSRRI